MLKDNIPSPAKLKNWRDIEQKGKVRPIVTRIGRRRRFFLFLKHWAITMSVLCVIMLLGFMVYLFRIDQGMLKVSLPSHQIGKIQFKSDGYLTLEWFNSLVLVPPEVNLLNVDILAVKKALMKEVQIKGVSVSRRFPNTLEVSIKERKPILRARFKDEHEEVRSVLIASDGVVYKGHAYPKQFLSKLPFITEGIQFLNSESGIKPVTGIGPLTKLLDIAPKQYPAVYNTWKWVAIRNYGGEIESSKASIVIKSRDVEEIVFAPMEFERQLELLSRLLHYSRESKKGKFKHIDLTLEEQIVVRNST